MTLQIASTPALVNEIVQFWDQFLNFKSKTALLLFVYKFLDSSSQMDVITVPHSIANSLPARKEFLQHILFVG